MNASAYKSRYEVMTLSEMFHRPNMASKELLIILAITQFYLETSGAPSSAEKNPAICDTVECRQIANEFSQSMNRSVDPCVDFYEFTCGKWKSEDGIPKTAKHWFRSDDVEFLSSVRLRGELESPSTSEDILPVQQAKQFYQSCMDNNTREANGLERIHSILRNTNGWPMVMSNGTWNTSISWQEIDRYYFDWMGHAFYGFITNCNGAGGPLAPSFQIAAAAPPSSIYFINFENHTQEILYRSMIKSTAQIFIEEHGTSVSNEEFEKDIDDLIKFEKRLREAYNNASSHEETRLYLSSNDSDIFKLNGFIRWWNNRTESIATTSKAEIDLYDDFQREFSSENLSIDENTGIIFQQFGYFIELIKTLEATDARTIVNYIQWKYISSSASYFTERIRRSIVDHADKILGVPPKQPRWQKCLQEMEMKEANMYIFIQKYHSNSTFEAFDKMVNHLKESLALQITNSSFSNRTIEAMKRKLNQIIAFIGYPAWLKNETALINYYEGLTIGNDYFENTLNYKQYAKRAAVRHCAGTIATGTLFFDSFSLNAFYDIPSNSLRVSPIAVQFPILKTGVPDYINYGIIGAMIGHEIAHAYGTFAQKGNETILKDADDWKIYEERLTSFMNFFTEYYKVNNITLTVRGIPIPSNIMEAQGLKMGDLTVDENMADWIGTQAALHAYKEMRKKKLPNGELKLPQFLEYNDQQMFFISYAQRWCEKPKSTSIEITAGLSDHPPYYSRVNGPLSITPAFADSFNCTKNTPMNLGNKNNFWNSPID